VETFDWAQVMAWRARRHQLDERAPAEAMLEVTARIAGLHVTIEPFTKLPAWARRTAEGEAERLAAWSGIQLELDWAEQR